MRLHRFYIKEDQGVWEKEGLIIKDSVLLHQMIKVLRFKKGDHIIGFHETEGEYELEILELSRKECLTRFVKLLREKEERNGGIHLFVSLIKKDRFEWLIEKITELGVKRITPIISSRTDSKNFSLERFTKISIEAIEQSGQITPPKIFEAIKIEDAILKCDVDKTISLHTSNITIEGKIKNVENIFIGPEGGWSEEDIKMFEENKITFVRLDTPVLRTETAATIAAYEFSKK